MEIYYEHSADMFDLESIDRTDEYHRLTYFDFIMNSVAHIESVAEIGAGNGWNLVPFIYKDIECQGYVFHPN